MEHTQVVQEQSVSGLLLRVHALTHVTRFSRSPQGTLNEHRDLDGRFMVEARLEGAGMLLEPGAFLYSVGQIEAEVRQQQAGGFLRRAVASAGTGESAFATHFTGHGTVWTEPSKKHFLISSTDSPGDTVLLDDGAFYLAQDTMQLGTHRHTNITGALSGNGLQQPKLTGQGLFVVESPVPVSEVEVIEVNAGRSLVVDGDMMLMYTGQLQVSLRPLVRGLRNMLRSGEGLVYTFTGEGTVFLTPTARRVSVASTGG